eukprot:TRINITY_DN2738_c0_g1_i1.p1 TRINITY_DN2738_c0_g1~~TRINITY_DN2738_c0_g1_i1.p1  ORF type:complete len:362 (+),score=61.64 TRINITY_DN2738_c0_g1_i1:49-1134(+)
MLRALTSHPIRSALSPISRPLRRDHVASQIPRRFLETHASPRPSNAAAKILIGSTLSIGGLAYYTWTATDVPPFDPDGWKVQALKCIPTRLFSRAWGTVHHLTLPEWARAPLYRAWTDAFGCNLSEIKAASLNEYENLAQFFARELKDGARPLSPEKIISPVDGRVLHFGEVRGNEIEQVKGITYPMDQFLGEVPKDFAPIKPGNKLYHCIIYLAPGDYHRIHAPADWKIERTRHFSGELFSVAPRVLELVKSLFVLNERVVLSGTWEHGYFSMTAVGAYNVGSIGISFDQSIVTNLSSQYNMPSTLRTYAKQVVAKGDEVASFNLGSTVVLVFESPEYEFTVKPFEKVRLGQALGHFVEK